MDFSCVLTWERRNVNLEERNSVWEEWVLGVMV